MFGSLKLAAIGMCLISAGCAAPANTDGNAVTVTQIESSSPTAHDWQKGWSKEFPIHSSCNATKYNQLRRGLQEAQLLAAHARDHTLKNGNSSEFYRKYFGNEPVSQVVGWFSTVVDADKDGLIFRCDNPDGNCDLDGYAGHWRGENATDETVICDLSFTTRQYLFQLCSQGYTVAGSKNTVYWGSDLLHRIFHTERIYHEKVGHFADSYEECLELAKKDPAKAVSNSATLRYYALDVYAYDIAVPGKGCTGEAKDEGKKEDSGSTTSAPTPTETQKGGSECHTHANGETHCV